MKGFLYKYWPFFLGMFLGLYYITLTVTGTDLGFYPGDLADTRFNIYILEHAYRFFLVGDVPTEGYWNAPFIYPQSSIVTFSDNLLGVAPLYAIFRSVGFDLFTSFQLWFIVLTALNYTASYSLFNWLLKNRYAAVLGAMVFTFSIALFGQMAHPQTFPRFCIPLAFLFACKFHNTLSARDFFLTVFFVVYQFYCTLYLGFMLMIPIAIMIVSTLILRRNHLLKNYTSKWAYTLLGALLLNILIITPLAIPYVNSPLLITSTGSSDYVSYEEVFQTIPLFRSFLFVRTYSYFWWCLNQVGMDLPAWWDHQLFPGATVIVASCFLFLHLISLVLDRSKKVNGLFVIISIAIAGTFLLFTRTDHFSFYQYLYALPGFGTMRSIGRIINVEVLFFGLITAITFAIITKNSKKQAIFFLVVMAYFMFDNYIDPVGYTRENKAESKERIAYLEKQMRQINSEKVVCLETYLNKDEPIFYQIDAMLAAQQYGLKVINGYTSNCPPNYSFCTNLDSLNRKYWMEINNIREEEVEVVYQDFDFELPLMMYKIKNNGSWLEKVKEQAIKDSISLEENIRKNAIWMLENG